MYVTFNPDDALNQGDIIDNVVVTYLPFIAQPSIFVDGERSS